MNKPITIEHATRAQIAAFLPEAIELAVTSYKAFMQKGVEPAPDSTKDDAFVTHHKSAKIAISHIELLIKLAKWADLPDERIESDKDAAYLAGLMAAAEAEVESYEAGVE